MKSQAVTVFVALLALCCLLIPKGGESAGGIISFQQSENARKVGDQMRDETLDDPQSEQGLVADPLPQGSSIKTKRDTEETQAGILDRVRRAPDESKKKKDKKKKKKEPKDPNATKKPKTDKKGKKKDKHTTTTLPPTTTTIPTEPPTEPYTDYQYPYSDYWKLEDEYWDAEPTPSRPQPDIPIIDRPDSSQKLDEEDPAAPLTDAYDDYWKPEEEDPAAPVTDAYDDYWKPEEKEFPTLAPNSYDDYMNPDKKAPYTPVTEDYDSYWPEVNPTPRAPEVDAKFGTDDSGYWDATDEVPLPDGKDVSPEIKVETLPEEPTAIAPYEENWFYDYDEYGISMRTLTHTDMKYIQTNPNVFYCWFSHRELPAKKLNSNTRKK